ncbi:MAG: hypothetical protein IKV27_07505 [Lachnospiraceae bacterium]|nr:hypothetical protein [Lachnospiraceae bacterium]
MRWLIYKIKGCHWWKHRKGSVVDVMSVGICVIAMTVLMLAYMGSVQLLNSKSQIDQITRKYILRMETVGYLTGNDRLEMTQELAALGATELDYTGSTLNQVDYGSAISLVVRGKIPVRTVVSGSDLFNSTQEIIWYEFEERRISTAKN